MRFYDREKELELLTRTEAAPGAKMVVLTGRRRIGIYIKRKMRMVIWNGCSMIIR